MGVIGPEISERTRRGFSFAPGMKSRSATRGAARLRNSRLQDSAEPRKAATTEEAARFGEAVLVANSTRNNPERR